MIEVTDYFKNSVLIRRPYLQEEWIKQAKNNPIEVREQIDGRMQHFMFIAEYNKYLRVVFEGNAVHNAFFDRKYKPKSH